MGMQNYRKERDADMKLLAVILVAVWAVGMACAFINMAKN